MKIIVDADATPREVIEKCREAAENFMLEVWTVASFNHNITGGNHITVGNGPQEADLKVANMTSRGDIVVTQDFGLAALALAKGAGAISPRGRIYTSRSIEFLLEEREVKAKIRRGGGKTKGPSPKTPSDCINFGNNLLELIKKALNNSSLLQKE